MQIPVNLEKDSYNIIIERGALDKAGEYLNLERKVMVVTDSGVPSEHVEKIVKTARNAVLVVLPEGEQTKTLESFGMLCRKLLDEGFTRKDCVVAVGGGVVGDLAGFAAACYMRGIDFYNVPTTLLAQVDSSVGGKTAVNLGDVKNIVGAFHQPKAVLIDPDVLKTLSLRQFACGAAEIIKMAMTFDKTQFEKIQKEGVAADLDYHIAKAVKIKAGVVEQDEKERGPRKALNFGHTIGHGIESVTGMLHGECVALGMLPMCSPELKKTLATMLEKEGLPTECSADPEAVTAAAMHDKKAEEGSIVTVRVNKIGSFEFVKADEEDMRKLYEECFW